MNDLTLIAASSAVLPDAVFEGRHLIGGKWAGSGDGATFERVSPSHGVVVSRSALGGAVETEAAIAAARAASSGDAVANVSLRCSTKVSSAGFMPGG